MFGGIQEEISAEAAVSIALSAINQIIDMERIDEIKRMLVKKATGFTTGGFKPTNSDSESWI